MEAGGPLTLSVEIEHRQDVTTPAGYPAAKTSRRTADRQKGAPAMLRNVSSCPPSVRPLLRTNNNETRQKSDASADIYSLRQIIIRLSVAGESPSSRRLYRSQSFNHWLIAYLMLVRYCATSRHKSGVHVHETKRRDLSLATCRATRGGEQSKGH